MHPANTWGCVHKHLHTHCIHLKKQQSSSYKNLHSWEWWVTLAVPACGTQRRDCECKPGLTCVRKICSKKSKVSKVDHWNSSWQYVQGLGFSPQNHKGKKEEECRIWAVVVWSKLEFPFINSTNIIGSLPQGIESITNKQFETSASPTILIYQILKS